MITEDHMVNGNQSYWNRFANMLCNGCGFLKFIIPEDINNDGKTIC